jgi:Na+/melibiose symporter-like transporter
MVTIFFKSVKLYSHKYKGMVTKSRTKFLYGLGAFGYGSIGQTMGSFLMFFGTAVLGIPGVLMGIAVGLGTVCDATTDPFVGHISDNTRSRTFGKRHGFILFACVAVALTNLMLWSISPTWSVALKFLVLTALLLIIETFSTFYSTPYSALGLDLAKSYNERTAIQGYKTVFSFLSLIVPSILMTLFLTPTDYVTMGASVGGYQKIAIFTSSLCIICGLVCFAGTLKHKTQSTMQTKRSSFKEIFTDFFSILKQKNVPLLILGYAVSLTAGAFITSLGLHVFTYTFGFSTVEIPIIMGCLIGGIILGQPIWLYISRKTDKVTALITALGVVILGIIVFAVVLSFRNAIYPIQVLPLVMFTMFLAGVGTGCLYSVPISMYADLVDLQNKKTGIDKTAKATGFLTFCTKISNALIMFLIGVSLDLVGFRGGARIQSIATQNWLGWLLIAGVGVACVTAIFIYSKYSFNKQDFKI